MKEQSIIKRHIQVVLMPLVAGFLSVQVQAASVHLDSTGNSQARNGVYEGFYQLTVDSTSVLAMCDDFNTNVSVGDSWTGYAYNYGQVTSNPSLVKFSPLSKYSEAGWLFNQLPIPGSNSADYSTQADIAMAIQEIMAPGSVNFTGYSVAQAYYGNATDGSHVNYDWSSVMMVLAPDPHSASQEYLIPTGMVPPSSVVPVPAAVWLFGSGLVGLVTVATRRKPASGADLE